jgi:hypothetical protein
MFRDDTPFTRADGERLASFSCQDGGNRCGRPVRCLEFYSLAFDDENGEESSLRFLEQFIACTSDKFQWPETLQGVFFGNLPRHVLQRLLSSLHTNMAVKSLGISDWNLGPNGAMIGGFLLKNHGVTALELSICQVDAVYLHAMIPGLLASRGRLQSLSFNLVGLGYGGIFNLEALRVVYNHIQILDQLQGI